MTEEARFMRKLRKIRAKMSKDMETMTADEWTAYRNKIRQEIEKDLKEHGLSHLIVNGTNN